MPGKAVAMHNARERLLVRLEAAAWVRASLPPRKS